MSLTERIIDLALWWSLIIAVFATIWHAATYPNRIGPASPLEGQREAEHQNHPYDQEESA